MKEKIKFVFIYQTSPRSTSDANLTRLSLEKINRSFPSVPVFSNLSLDGATVVSGTQMECLRKTAEGLCQDDQDSGAVFYDLFPFLDDSLLDAAIHDHMEYLAHYTYVDNVPPGFLCDLVSWEWLRDTKIFPENVRDHIYKNIDKYDVEIFYRLPDLRQKRLDFSTASARSRRLASDALEIDKHLDYTGLLDFILDHPEILRPFPSYFELEVTSKSDVKPVFIPRREKEVEMDFALAQKLALDIRENGLFDDATISLSGFGDPCFHPRIPEMIELFTSLENVRTVYLETYGTRFDKAFADKVERVQNSGKIQVIVKCTTLRPDRYRALYGADLFGQVNANLSALSEMKRSFAVYAEMIKMKDIEDEISAYFDRFNGSINPILGKFNTYIDRLEERRVSDLTPLGRDFCWHLARDFYLSAEGRSPVCRQDPFAERSSLDFHSMSIKSILEKTMIYHSSSIRDRHENIPMPCLNCDEWYTFNG